jgi:glutathione synthase/RimK-type ligase-like ATP-grasp enzyme
VSQCVHGIWLDRPCVECSYRPMTRAEESTLRAERDTWRHRALFEQEFTEQMRSALTKAHLALTALGCRVQNDRGTWKIRRPHEDMAAVITQANEAMAAYHAVLTPAEKRRTPVTDEPRRP